MYPDFAAIKQNDNQVLRDKTEYVLSRRKAKTLASVQGFPFAYISWSCLVVWNNAIVKIIRLLSLNECIIHLCCKYPPKGVPPTSPTWISNPILFNNACDRQHLLNCHLELLIDHLLKYAGRGHVWTSQQPNICPMRKVVTRIWDSDSWR